MPSTSSITLLNTIEWAKKLVFLRPSAIGNQLEPAVTNANLILQTILGAPFAWRWNRTITGFFTVPGQQDYFLFNWTVLAQVQVGYNLVDSNGNAQVAIQAGLTGTFTPVWNTTKGGTTVDNGVIWQNKGSLGTTFSTTYAFDWIETASIQVNDPNTNCARWIQISPQINLALDSAQARPNSISAQIDDGLGNITFRMMPVPDKVYPVSLTIQSKPPIITSLNQTWSPIPDEYSRLYEWGFLSLMFLFADDPRFQLANQKFVSSLLASNQGLTQTQVNIFLNNWQAITGQPMVNQERTNQGIQLRAA